MIRDISIWRLFWRPFLTLRFPAVIWCILTYGVCLGWLALEQTAGSAAFPALYNFSSLAVGNIGIAVRASQHLYLTWYTNKGWAVSDSSILRMRCRWSAV